MISAKNLWVRYKTCHTAMLRNVKFIFWVQPAVPLFVYLILRANVAKASIVKTHVEIAGVLANVNES
jgi:hypothetical protein